MGWVPKTCSSPSFQFTGCVTLDCLISLDLSFLVYKVGILMLILFVLQDMKPFNL